MVSILDAGKKLGRWYFGLMGERWVSWTFTILVLYFLWSSYSNAQYWLFGFLVISISLQILGGLFQLFGTLSRMVAGRGDATAIQAIKADLRHRWETRPALAAYLREKA